MESSIIQVAQEFKQRMQRVYGEQLVKVLLYGSYARGDFHEESDIDLMVVLDKQNFQLFQEICKITEESTPLSLAHNKILAVVPTTLTKFEHYDSMFFRNIHQEGIEL